MTSTLVASYLGQGLAAARPATPAVSAGALAFYQATDTGVISTYYSGAWHTLITGGDPGTPPTIVQSKMAVANSASITLTSAPINGNLLVAMTFNPSNGTQGAGWTDVADNGSGTDFGLIAIKVAGAGESATQTPLNGAGNGLIAMWEINGQAAPPVVYALTQIEQAQLFAIPPFAPTFKNCLTLSCISLVSASNSLSKVFGMTQDNIISSGTVRQGVMGHNNGSSPTGSPGATFTGSGTPGSKCGVIVITAP